MVSSGVAAASPGGAAAPATTAGRSQAGIVTQPTRGRAFTVAGTRFVTAHAHNVHPVAAHRAAGHGAQASRRSQQLHLTGLQHVVAQQHRHAAPGPCHSSELQWWICHAEQIMKQHGTPQSAIDTNAAFIVVMHESGGNPHAYNGWDSNAAAGTPSEGIAQTIGPTFNAYAVAGHHNIWNPVDNMVAAFRYAISRYGSMDNIPGVVAVRSGGSYVGY